MPLILERKAVLAEYARAAERRWVLPALNTENLTGLEAILAAARDFGEAAGHPDLPLIVGLTNCYAHRSQSIEYTHTGDWRIGLRLFLDDVAALTAPGSPFSDLHVMIHMDHIQWDIDAELLAGDLSRFSSIMFDASTLPFEENMQRTAAFVARHGGEGGEIVIEGACDEIAEATGPDTVALTTPDMAETYLRRTGVDIIVANLGTEHRASAADLRYHGEVARSIQERIGPRICLHGTSSVGPEQVAHLFDDGICKVNIWTALERDATPALLADMLHHAAKAVGPRHARALREAGLLGTAADATSQASVKYFTTSYRQSIIFEHMKRIVKDFLELWYVDGDRRP